MSDLGRRIRAAYVWDPVIFLACTVVGTLTFMIAIRLVVQFFTGR